MGSFIHSLIEDAVRTGSAESLDLVYALLGGGLASHCVNIATALLVDLQKLLLRQLKGSDDTSMKYLAILALLTSNAMPIAELAPATLSAPVEAAKVFGNSVQGHDYFAKKAAKTLDYVVLRVILAFSQEDRAKDVQYANDILRAIHSDLRNDWLEKKSATVRKLYEKVLRPSLDPRTRFAV